MRICDQELTLHGIMRYEWSLKTYPEPDGRAETLEGRLKRVASVSVLGLLDEGRAVVKNVCVR